MYGGQITVNHVNGKVSCSHEAKWTLGACGGDVKCGTWNAEYGCDLNETEHTWN